MVTSGTTLPAETALPLRSFLALMFLVAGVAQVVLLWFLSLSVPLMLVALVGCIYLLISIGLFGVSRFTLFAAAVVPALRLATGFAVLEGELWHDLQTGTDLMLSLGGASLAWRARHDLSV